MAASDSQALALMHRPAWVSPSTDIPTQPGISLTWPRTSSRANASPASTFSTLLSNVTVRAHT